MADKQTNLHPKNNITVNLRPNIIGVNIPEKAVSLSQLTQEVQDTLTGLSTSIESLNTSVSNLDKKVDANAISIDSIVLSRNYVSHATLFTVGSDNTYVLTFEALPIGSSLAVFKGTLTKGRHYKIQVNCSDTVRMGLMKTNYSWLNSDVGTGTGQFIVDVTPTEDCWIAFYNMRAEAYEVTGSVYVYDITDMTENQLNILATYGYDHLGMVNLITFSYTATTAGYSDNSAIADKVTTRWFGKKIWICGDSITEYNWYPPVLAELLGVAGYMTDGHSGKAISGCVENVESDMTLLNDYDIMTLFAGTNDFGGNKALGTIDSAMNNDTTYGSLKLFIEQFCTTQPTKTLVLITPLPRGKFETQPGYDEPNGVGKKLTDYVNAIREVGEMYHIPVIDLYDTIGWNQYNIGNVTIDNLHPTESISKDVLAKKIYLALSIL